jgi:hypothetical protein
MSEDSPVYNAQTIVVTTDDGTLFSCTPHLGGVHAPRQTRWRLNGRGPVAIFGTVPVIEARRQT